MAQRSNQAVASQEQQAPLPEDPTPPPRRFLVGWATALVALATSTLLLGGIVWLARFPIAEFLLGAALAERHVEADFKIVKLDFQNAIVREVRIGPAGSPDVSIDSVRAHWVWQGLAPNLDSITLVQPSLRLSIDDGGHVSAGALDHVKSAPSGGRPTIPRLLLRIEDGVVTLHGPFGDLQANVRADGVIGQDFLARAVLREADAVRGAYAVQHPASELIVESRNDTAAFRLSLDLDGLRWNRARFENVALRAIGRAPLDLSRYGVEAAWRMNASTDAFDADSASGAVSVTALTRTDSLLPTRWRSEMHAGASHFSASDIRIERPRLDGVVDGDSLRGHGNWAFGADTLTGASIASTRPVAAGVISVDLNGLGALEGGGHITLADSRLTRSGEQAVRDFLPRLDGAPVAPTFAKARQALLIAGQRFNLDASFTAHADPNGARIVSSAPISVHSASGAILQLKPLRRDTPALAIQWPDASLHGAIELDLSGGGAPNAALLLDSVDWAPGAPFDAQGTLSLTDWRTADASISTDELNIGITVAPNGRGRVDLSGPTRISGPFGDGAVRDLVADLDIGILWDAGWRVIPNQHCLPASLTGLDAAGLSFAAGRFRLCAINDALIAASESGRLSGGFRIENLALDGHMSGPDAQPARLGAASVVAQFSGATSDVALEIAATAPSIAVTLAEGRVLALRGANLTANARLGEHWRVDGAFEQGSLVDPALPGAVSAIQGQWNASPDQNGKAVIRVEAGQALLSALTPHSQDERPLFHTLRILGLNASLNSGLIDAHGNIIIEDGARQLASFTARHDVDSGIGQAQILANAITFGPSLQPYDISELARGMVENVRGPARAEADIAWDSTHIRGSGVLRLDGVSLATSTIPIVQNVRGDINFNDLFTLTTPPHQHLHVGVLNPGIAVTDGDVFFQLLADQRVAIEQAQFGFASGKISLTPTTISLGADETRFELTLQDIDAAALIATLNIPDVGASGRVQGRFPLLLTRRSAYVQDGLLESQADGGTISYVGHAGDDSVGMARVAFDALRNFRYDSLQLTLNGDLAGEVVSQIQFTGHNSGKPVDLGPLANVPGVGRVTVRGVPFDFHVSVTAPFRSLADTAASIVDPTHLLHEGRQNQAPRPVDQAPQTPR